MRRAFLLALLLHFIMTAAVVLELSVKTHEAEIKPAPDFVEVWPSELPQVPPPNEKIEKKPLVAEIPKIPNVQRQPALRSVDDPKVAAKGSQVSGGLSGGAVQSKSSSEIVEASSKPTLGRAAAMTDAAPPEQNIKATTSAATSTASGNEDKRAASSSIVAGAVQTNSTRIDASNALSLASLAATQGPAATIEASTSDRSASPFAVTQPSQDASNDSRIGHQALARQLETAMLSKEAHESPRSIAGTDRSLNKFESSNSSKLAKLVIAPLSPDNVTAPGGGITSSATDNKSSKETSNDAQAVLQAALTRRPEAAMSKSPKGAQESLRPNASDNLDKSLPYPAFISAYIASNIQYNGWISEPVEARVLIKLSPDGTIASRKIVSSSKIKSWDEAVLVAVDRTEKIPPDADGKTPPQFVAIFRRMPY
jgi:TonB family protein